MATGVLHVEEIQTLKIDYSIRPSLIPTVEPGGRISLTRFGLIEHPTRTDVTLVDIAKIGRQSMVRPDEIEISGDEYLKRLKGSGAIMPDVRVMEEFLKNQSKIPETYRDGVTCFFGTQFIDRSDDRFIAGFVWNGRWFVHYLYCLRLPFTDKKFAACLAAPFSDVRQKLGCR